MPTNVHLVCWRHHTDSIDLLARVFRYVSAPSPQRPKCSKTSGVNSGEEEVPEQLLSALLHDRKAIAGLETAPTSRDAARLRSVHGRGAGSWLEAIPGEKVLALSPSDFRLAASLCLGINLPFSSWGLICQCGKEVDEFYLLTCKLGGGPVWEHNEIVAG